MFEIKEKEVQRLAEEYEVSEQVVRRYAKLLSSSNLITDEDTFAIALEEAVQMAAPVASWQLGIEKYKEPGRPIESVLSKTLSVVVGSDDEEIAEDVGIMIDTEAERVPSRHKGK